MTVYCTIHGITRPIHDQRVKGWNSVASLDIHIAVVNQLSQTIKFTSGIFVASEQVPGDSVLQSFCGNNRLEIEIVVNSHTIWRTRDRQSISGLLITFSLTSLGQINRFTANSV